MLDHNFKSIIIPTFCTGTSKILEEDFIKILLKTLKEYIDENKKEMEDRRIGLKGIKKRNLQSHLDSILSEYDEYSPQKIKRINYESENKSETSEENYPREESKQDFEKDLSDKDLDNTDLEKANNNLEENYDMVEESSIEKKKKKYLKKIALLESENQKLSSSKSQNSQKISKLKFKLQSLCLNPNPSHPASPSSKHPRHTTSPSSALPRPKVVRKFKKT